MEIPEHHPETNHPNLHMNFLFGFQKIRNEFSVWNMPPPPRSDDIFSLGHTISLIAEDQFTTSMWTMDLTSLTGVFLSQGLVGGCLVVHKPEDRSNRGNPKGPPATPWEIKSGLIEG